MPAACYLQDVMQPETMELDTLGNVKQEFPENAHMSKLVCFFCDKEFPGVQVLHSHQQECALASNSQKVLTATKNSVGKKRSFLSYLNLIPKLNAEHVRSEKRTDVVLDVIVIDDDSDDENKDLTKDKSQRYLLSPSSLDSKTKQNGRIRSKTRNGGLALVNAFAKPSSKVFKFDISSPLGMRLRYHCRQIGNSKLPISKICRANYELYCGLSTKKSPHSNRCYHVTYRKSRQPAKYCHQYKFTRAQLKESFRSRRSGLSLRSLRLKQQMKPCVISVEKLNLLHGDMSRGTFDARKHLRMLNLKMEVESSTGVSDEETTISRTSIGVDTRELSAVLPDGLLSIVGGLQDSHHSGDDSMRSSLQHPTERIRTYKTFRLRNPDARSTDDAFSPVSNSCSGFAGWNEPSRAFPRTVEFVPLTSLYEQSALDVENHDPQMQMIRISSVYSLAEGQDNAETILSDLPEELHCTEGIDSLVESLPPQTLPSSASSADIITIVDHDNSSLEPSEPSSQVREKLPTSNGLLASATDVIDLTENISSSLPVSSEACTTISQRSVVVNSRDKLRDVLQKLSENLCSMSSDKLQKLTDVHKLSTEKSSAQQTTALQKELERTIVIEIPDEDSAVFSAPQRNHAAQSQSCNGTSRTSDISVTSNNLGNSNEITALPSQRLPDKSSHSVQPTVSARVQTSVQTNDTIDLSFDSDTEVLDKEPVATGQKRPLLSNSANSCPPRKRDRPGVSLEHSALPPLTFKCHICDCFFNFDNNSGTMIRKHYLLHNVTNIELVKQVLPNGQTTWSLVELNNVDRSKHSKPSGPCTSSSVPNTRISPNHVGIEDSSTRPSVTMHYTPTVANSSRSAVRQNIVFPEYVFLEQSSIPETLSSSPDVPNAGKRSSPNAARLDSEKNCNILPARHVLPSVYASNVANSNTAGIISSTVNDTVLSQAGRQERNDVPLQGQTIDARRLRAIHLAQLRPNVLRTPPVLRPNISSSTPVLRPNISSSTPVLRPNISSSTPVLRPNISSSTPVLRPNVPSSTRVLVGSVPRASSAEQRHQIRFPMSANLNRVFVNGRERGDDANVGNQMQSKHNALASQSNNNIVHGVICLD